MREVLRFITGGDVLSEPALANANQGYESHW
jgi:hypothetical protein